MLIATLANMLGHAPDSRTSRSLLRLENYSLCARQTPPTIYLQQTRSNEYRLFLDSEKHIHINFALSFILEDAWCYFSGQILSVMKFFCTVCNRNTIEIFITLSLFSQLPNRKRQKRHCKIEKYNP